MPILGTIASSKQTAADDYVFIDKFVSNGSESSVTFTVPNTYKHLQVRSMVRHARSNTNGPTWIQPNNDQTAANYAVSYLYSYGVGNNVGAGLFLTTEPGMATAGAGTTAATGIYGIGVATIYDYNDTNKFKSCIAYGGLSNNNSGDELTANHWIVWRNTNAITSLVCRPFTAPYAVNSVISLYGIKG